MIRDLRFSFFCAFFAACAALSALTSGISFAVPNEGDANQNTYFGTNTEAGVSFPGSTADYNTFFGYDSGKSTTAGDDNTFVGHSSGFTNNSGQSNTFLGRFSGYYNSSGSYNLFLGFSSGFSNETGYSNTFVGSSAGNSNTTGYNNTFIGDSAGGSNTTGSGNVFLGYSAGSDETGSNRLYIDNSNTTTPLIYGEFDNNIVTVNGKLGIGTATPQTSLDTGGGDITVNGADTSGGVGGRKPGLSTPETGRMNIGYGGTGGANLEMYSKGHASRAGELRFVYGGGSYGSIRFIHYDGAAWTTRMLIDKDGNVGLGTESPAYPIHHSSGARLTAGGAWTNASSREYKENISRLSADKALNALKALDPVEFTYKADKEERHTGFIAEDAPELVATKDRKGLSPMDIVAVLTKVVQEQQDAIAALRAEVKELKKESALKKNHGASGLVMNK